LADITVFVKEATKEQPIQEIEEILMKLDGIERALVDVNDGELKITYNENQIEQEQIINRIKQHGLHLTQ
jgi:copper chaperone CopZ